MTFSFDHYTVRPITEKDRAYLAAEIAADPDHRDTVEPDFFLKPEPGETSWALEDEQGRVVFYFKTSPVVRMAVQFTGQMTLANKRRNAAGMMRGLEWIRGMFSAARFTELLFDTRTPELEAFAKRRLGFVNAPGLLALRLAMFKVETPQPEGLGNVPNSGLERLG